MLELPKGFHKAVPCTNALSSCYSRQAKWEFMAQTIRANIFLELTKLHPRLMPNADPHETKRFVNQHKWGKCFFI